MNGAGQPTSCRWLPTSNCRTSTCTVHRWHVVARSDLPTPFEILFSLSFVYFHAIDRNWTYHFCDRTFRRWDRDGRLFMCTFSQRSWKGKKTTKDFIKNIISALSNEYEQNMWIVYMIFFCFAFLLILYTWSWLIGFFFFHFSFCILLRIISFGEVLPRSNRIICEYRTHYIGKMTEKRIQTYRDYMMNIACLCMIGFDNDKGNMVTFVYMEFVNIPYNHTICTIVKKNQNNKFSISFSSEAVNVAIFSSWPRSVCYRLNFLNLIYNKQIYVYKM